MKKQRSSVARRIGGGFAIAAFLFLAVELLLRLLGYGSFILYQPDEQLLWVPMPNQDGRTVIGRHPISINSQSLRYPSDLRLAAPSEIRVVAFGDSVTMGWGVDDDSHYSSVLERLLAESVVPHEVRVISAGVNAYPMSLGVRRFEKLLSDGLQIDMAVIAYSFNQSLDRMTRLEGEAKEKLLERVALKSNLRRIASYNFFIEGLLRKAVYYRIRGRLVAGSWETEAEDPKSGEAQAAPVDYFVQALERAVSVAQKYDVDLVFLLLSTRNQKEQLGKNQGKFLQFALDHQIPIVNMVEVLEHEDHSLFYLGIDQTHPNKKGHARIAKELLTITQELINARGAASRGPD